MNRRTRLISSLFLLCTLVTFPLNAALAWECPTLFGIRGEPITSASHPQYAPLIQQWEDVRKRQAGGSGLGSADSLMPVPTLRQWENLRAGFPRMTPEEQLRNINGFFNSWTPITDARNYGREEYWACSMEFLVKGGGDCEDYSIIKYFALRELGWSADNLWIVLVSDTQRKTEHAVLLARTGQRLFVLDNLSRPGYLIMPPETYQRLYIPRFAFNEDGACVYSPKITPPPIKYGNGK